MRKPLFVFALLTAVLLSSVPAAEDTPKLLKVFNVPVNTSADEDEPHVSANGLTLYFTAPEGGKDEVRYSQRRSTAQVWPVKVTVLEDYIKAKGDLRSVYATGGTYPHYLYFATRDEKGKNFDLFVAVCQDVGKAWSAPTPVMMVNSDEDELHPWVTGDGKALYFSRKTKDGWKLLVTTRAGKSGPQGWGEPEEVGLPVGFHHATLTPDGKTMYLQGPLDKARSGLFVCTRTGKTWSKPEPLDGLNHPEGKIGSRAPNLTRDGRLLYFSSDRPDGRGGLDLWGIQTAMLGKKK